MRGARPVAALVVAMACASPPATDDVDDTDVDTDTDDLRPTGPDAVIAAPALALVDETVTLDASGSLRAVQARWNFDDGSVTDWSDVLTVTHAWSSPGHRTVSLEVQGEDGTTSVATVVLAVTYPATQPPPRASSSVVTLGDRAYVATPDLGAVAVVDLTGRQAVAWLTDCPTPRRLSVAPWPQGQGDGDVGLLAVACEQGRPGVFLYDVHADGSVTERGRADLSNSGRSVFGVVLGDDLDVVATMRGREDPTGRLLTWDADMVPGAQPGVGSDVRGLAWQPGQVVATRHRSPDAYGLWWTWVPTTQVLDTWTLAVETLPDNDISSRGVPTYLQAVAIRPDGHVAVIAGLRANVLGGLVRDGAPLTDENTVRADIRLVSVDDALAPTGTELDHGRLDDRDLVSAVAYAPRGDWLYAATLGTRTIEVLDAFTLGNAGVWVDTGHGVDGLAVSDDGRWLLAHARYDRALDVYDLDGEVGADPVARIDLREDGVEPWDGQVLAGARVFHDGSDPRMSKDGYASCASCHLDGEDDHRVWDFTDRGEGLRNTVSLRGFDRRVGLPIHWSGNFDEVQDFEHDIRGPQGGRGFLTDAQFAGPAGTTLGAPKAGLSPALDALAAYVAHEADLDVSWGVDVSEGQAIFDDPAVGCASCHPDGGSASGWLSPGVPALVDVGTIGPASGHRLGGELTGLDIPDLHGVWATPPYLHDGSAPTLRDVLTTANPDDLHGVTSDLTADQLDALEQYLRAL
ncbi:MAG: PKD domain-containing protein [Alphaproteobacteria bacterium]|nr:PKD domain-containing protein [Alphaproteobacteria bacterium]